MVDFRNRPYPGCHLALPGGRWPQTYCRHLGSKWTGRHRRSVKTLTKPTAWPYHIEIHRFYAASLPGLDNPEPLSRMDLHDRVWNDGSTHDTRNTAQKKPRSWTTTWAFSFASRWTCIRVHRTSNSAVTFCCFVCGSSTYEKRKWSSKLKFGWWTSAFGFVG